MINQSRGQPGIADSPMEDRYAGDVDARAAWDMLRGDSASYLIDVRTKPEWAYVGVPVLDELGRNVLFIEWQSYPNLQVNQNFSAEVASEVEDRDARLLFICRSGARSRSAAIEMTKAGYKNCYNVSGGFEGPQNADGHRGGVDGWKVADLPWKQA